MPDARLVFLHTSPVHVKTFERLLVDCGAYTTQLDVEHIVDESLLQQAREQGGVTPELRRQVERYIREADERGASVIVCTCSSIGGIAEAYNEQASATVTRVDRAMAEEAVRLGPRVLLVAALETTLEPTRALLLDAARRAGREIHIVEVHCREAWQHFERGDQDAYLREVASQLRIYAHECDVVVLAQASMAGVVELCPDLTLPMLTSPRLGTLTALRAYEERQEQAASNGEPERDTCGEEASK